MVHHQLSEPVEQPLLLGHAEIDIERPAHEVWAALTAFDDYHLWNSFMPRIEGTVAEGEPITLHVNLRGERILTTEETVSRFDADAMVLSWRYNSPRWLLHFEREQRVEVIDTHRCRYVSDESGGGLMAWLVVLTNRGAVTRAFERVAHDLKAYMELRHPTESPPMTTVR